MEKSTFLSAEHRARIFPWPVGDWDSKVNEASSLSTLYDCALSLERAGSVGKMYPLLYPPREDGTSPDLFPSCAGGTFPFPTRAGEKPASSPTLRDVTDWHGEYLTLNIPEFPNFRGQSRSEGSVSSLSDILVVGAIPQKYYLTVKCAEGILRRAARRGRALPEPLRQALEALAGKSKVRPSSMPPEPR